MTNLSNEPHPDDLLGAYALHALNDVQEAQVEAHLDQCLQCRRVVSRLQHVTAQSGPLVAPTTPAPYIQSRIMEALSQARPQAIPVIEAAPVFGLGRRLSRILVPVSGALVIFLVPSPAYNVRLNRRIDRLEMENVSVSARLFNFSTEKAQLLEALRQQDVSSYLLANPASQPILLESPQEVRESWGVLLVADNCRHATVMVVGMQEPAPTKGYQVWLLRPGEGLRMGQVYVDSTDWGTKDLYLPEPLFRFDRVELRPEAAGGGSGPGDNVLEGSFASFQSPK